MLKILFKFFVNVAYQPKCFVYCFTVGSNDALVTLFRSAMYRDFKNIAFKQRSEASNIDITATGSCCCDSNC
jgi:hypothetical protein